MFEIISWLAVVVMFVSAYGYAATRERVFIDGFAGGFYIAILALVGAGDLSLGGTAAGFILAVVIGRGGYVIFQFIRKYMDK